MSFPTVTNLTFIEKIIELKWALFCFVILTFTECYLILSFGSNTSLLKINKEWFNQNVHTFDLINFILTFSIVLGLIIPGMLFILKELFMHTPLAIKLYNRTRFRPEKDYPEHYIHKQDLKNWAIKQSNLAAYKRYDEFEKEQKDIANIRYLCQCILIFSIISLVFSDYYWWTEFEIFTDRLPCIFC